MNFFRTTYRPGDVIGIIQNQYKDTEPTEYIILEDLSGTTYKCMDHITHQLLEMIKTDPKVLFNEKDNYFCKRLYYFFVDDSERRSYLNNSDPYLGGCYAIFKQRLEDAETLYVDIDKEDIIKDHHSIYKYAVTKKDTHTLAIQTKNKNGAILEHTDDTDADTISVTLDSNIYNYNISDIKTDDFKLYNNFVNNLKNIFDMYIEKVKYEIKQIKPKSGGKKIYNNTRKKIHTKRNKNTHTKRNKKTYTKRSKMRNKKVYKHNTLRK